MASGQQGDTLEERLKDPDYKNRLKAGMCLIRVKKGLETFVDTESKVLHQDILTKCTPCGQCTQDGIKRRNKQKLCPSCDSFKCEIEVRHKSRRPNWDNTDVQKWPHDHWSVSKCFMNPGQSGNNIPSDTDISGLLNFIIQCDRFRDPKYGDIQVNADKVREDRNQFIHSGHDQLSDADLKSYTNDMLKLLIDENPDGQLKGNQEAERAKVQIQEVVKANFLIYLEDECKVHLIDVEGQMDLIRSEMQETNGKLQETEQEFRKGAIIQGQDTEKIAEEVRGLKKKHEELQPMLDKIQQDRDVIQILKGGLQFQDTLIRNLDERAESKFKSMTLENMQFKEKLDEVQIQLDEVKSRVEQHDSQIRDHDSQLRDHGSQLRDLYDHVSGQREKMEAFHARKQKEDTVPNKEIDNIREDLKSSYKSLSTVSISPLEEEETAPVEEFFTDVIIEHQTDGKNSRDKKKEKLSSYKQIFLDKNNQRIVLTGLSGSGKSTFFRKLVCAWCKEEPNKQIDTTEMSDLSIPDSKKATADKKDDLYVPYIDVIIKDIKGMKTDSSVSESSEAIADQDILSSFTLLFYVYSPKMSNEKTLTEVLYNYCLKRESNQLVTFLQEHPEKILIILDGMDEMEDNISPFLSGLLERKLHPRIIVLMAMRPWKISKLRLKPVSHYDLLLEIQGFSKNNALMFVHKVVNLNMKHMTMERLSPTPEEKEVLSSFRNVPLLLLFVAHVWCQDQCLPKRRQDLYIKIIDCLIKRCLSKTGNKYALAMTDQHDINMKKNKFWDLCLNSICWAAYHFLLQGASGPSVVMREEDLMIKLGNNAQIKLSALLDCGILSKLDAFSPLEKNVSITFLHLSIQEYLTSRYLVSNEDAFQNFLISLKTLNDVLRYENLFIFFCGIDAGKGHMAFRRICQVCDEDTLVRQYRQERDYARYRQILSSVWNLNEMYKTCLNEMDSQELVEISDVTMHDNHELSKCLISRLRSCCVKSLHLESITLLHHHQVALKSLTNLTSLKLSIVELSEECRRSLCSSISGCTHLEGLQLNLMTLHDGVLELRNLTDLTYLTLKEVTMSEECSRSLCSSISGCTRLKILDLKSMTLQDGVLDLRSLTNLTSLRLGYVIMSEECSRFLCSSINCCTRLESLELINITLHDGVLDLTSLTNLASLTLWNITMSEECTRSLCNSVSGNTHLEELELIDIRLHDGVLELRSLTNLTSLKLSIVKVSEECSRSLCSSINGCTHLERLQLTSMKLYDGVLDLRSLTDLTYLTLRKVTMSDECSISQFSSISSCTHLKNLELKDITLHNGVLELRSLTNLTFLTLWEVIMSEECCRSLCSSISGCTHLEELELKDITLHDGVLELRSLTNLIFFTMGSVTLSEECSRSLCSSIVVGCTCLKNLELKDITLHDGVLELRSLTNLTFLTLMEVTMSDECCRSLCSSISGCTHLEELDLKDITLHDGLLELRSLTNLTFLTLWEVIMSEECSRSLCCSIGGCTHLKNLELKDITLHDGVLELRSLTNLIFFTMGSVTLSEECSRSLCCSISGCTHLKNLELKDITLHDGVLELRSLTNLTFLTLWEVTMSEECSRSLCSSISGCTHLKNLELKDITLHDGVLELRSLTNLTFLTLWEITMYEQCSRSLCINISGCTRLKNLELKDITLHDGVLELRSLTNLTFLTLWEVIMSEECSRSLCCSISGCTHLKNLELKDITLHDGVLELRSLTNLTFLTLWEVTMSEECSRSLCSSISGCTHLKNLELKDITLHDGVLELRSLTNLTFLTLWEVIMSEECSRSLCCSISGCTHLKNLELKDITLHDGVLELRSLTNLTFLTLWEITMYEQCSRSLCINISGCTRLKNLELKDITLHDGVLELRSLTNLTFLTLWEVIMSEECSRSLCSSISGCTHLKNLELKDITLHDGVLELRSLTNLIFFTMGSVTLSEECSRSLCCSISRCTHLEELELNLMTLHDGVLDLRSLTDLTYLTLSDVTMSEECSRSLCSSIIDCTHLMSLELKDITLLDGILELRSLTNLTVLTLGSVTMSEECSESLCGNITGCTHLEELDLKDITLYDGVLELRSPTTLTSLTLVLVTMSNECSRSLCSSINGCTHLESLELNHITLHDGVLDLRSLTNLTCLKLGEVTMSEECSRSLCRSISGCTHLKNLELKDITLHDGVLELRSLTNLTFLTLWEVTMSDECSRSLCSSMSGCTHLKNLELKDITLHDGVLDLRGLSHLRMLQFHYVTMSPQCRQTLRASLKDCQKLELREMLDSDFKHIEK